MRKLVRPKRVPGRVNHGVSPLAQWWHTGFERNPADWARSRIWRGKSGLRFPKPAPHEMRREAMSWGWYNYLENVAEREVTVYNPGPAEFHLIGMRYWLAMKEMQRPQKWWAYPVRPWHGPRYLFAASRTA